MESTCSDIITDWVVDEGATCLKFSGHIELFSSSCTPSDRVLSKQAEEWAQCLHAWIAQEESPLPKSSYRLVAIQTHTCTCLEIDW